MSRPLVPTGWHLPLVLLLTFAACRATAAQEIQWSSFEEARSAAADTGQPAVVYVRAPWCGACYRVETEVLPDVAEELRAFSAVARVDLGERPEPGTPTPWREWVRVRGLETPPAFAIILPDGDVRPLRGYVRAPELRAWMAAVLESSAR